MDRYQKTLAKMNDQELMDVAQHWKRYNYPESVREMALDILRSRGKDETDLTRFARQDALENKEFYTTRRHARKLWINLSANMRTLIGIIIAIIPGVALISLINSEDMRLYLIFLGFVAVIAGYGFLYNKIIGQFQDLEKLAGEEVESTLNFVLWLLVLGGLPYLIQKYFKVKRLYHEKLQS